MKILQPRCNSFVFGCVLAGMLVGNVLLSHAVAKDKTKAKGNPPCESVSGKSHAP